MHIAFTALQKVSQISRTQQGQAAEEANWFRRIGAYS